MGYKIITMKRQLLLYLIKLFVGIVVIIICWLALTNIFVECGVIIPANYSETILEENRKRLDDIQQITDNDLPYGSKYSIFDLDYNYERGTMNKSDIEVTKKILLGKESNLQGNYVYSVIARTEEYCVIKYNIKARFNSDNKIFNYIDYDNLSYITMVLVFLLYVYIMTLHVETVVLLSHKKADSYIHIDVEFGEGEGKIPVDSIAKRAEAYKPKEKVTYKMIKEYIEAKYGFKVHTAYIAEVKRNLGLPMYDAPNAVEELKQPRKHPTPEKVEAIKDALRYFAVI